MNPPPSASFECFALLDDSGGSDLARSRLYTGHLGSLDCADAAALPQRLEQMQAALACGRHAVLVFAYELGAGMMGLAPRAAVPGSAYPAAKESAPPSQAPSLSQILLFADCQRLTAVETEAWLHARRAESDSSDGLGDIPAGVSQVEASVTQAEFSAALARIHDYIKAGDTYQVNYTYRLHFETFGNLPALYLRLRARQPVPYGALVALPDGRAVLSLSPELFVRHSEGRLQVCPMKGTAPASGDAALDASRASALAADPKNRAENLMIVDLLRNDLGRIAAFGSVRVPALFEVNRFGAVLQMTSRIEARLLPDATLGEVFAALYPCGSITGAPKRRTMEIIRELEPDARGLYTGALGWFDPPPPADGPQGTAPEAAPRLGDFCLSVPIRTLTLQAPRGGRADGRRRGEMGVGSGIVYDSDALEEFAECQLKARFLTGLGHDFELFETMRASHQGCQYLERHLARLGESARHFGFAFDADALRQAVRGACAELPLVRADAEVAAGAEVGTEAEVGAKAAVEAKAESCAESGVRAEGMGRAEAPAFRLRLALRQDGQASLQSGALHALAGPVRLLLATSATDADNLFLRHKTSVRARYDAAWREAEARGAFDMLFCNTRGELTEGGRSNLFVKLDGRWHTPPLDAGLLPGVMRAVLLEDPAWDASERRLTLDDLRRAEQVVVCNALRGPLVAQVVWHGLDSD